MTIICISPSNERSGLIDFMNSSSAKDELLMPFVAELIENFFTFKPYDSLPELAYDASAALIQLWNRFYGYEHSKNFISDVDSMIAGLADGFERSFMNYSREYPDNWCDPEREWLDFPNLPRSGCILAILFMTAEKYGLADAARYGDLARRYFEYFAAMLTRTDSYDLSFALLASSYAASVHPEQAEYLKIAVASAARIDIARPGVRGLPGFIIEPVVMKRIALDAFRKIS